jgi:hypothetical protein
MLNANHCPCLQYQISLVTLAQPARGNKTSKAVAADSSQQVFPILQEPIEC